MNRKRKKEKGKRKKEKGKRKKNSGKESGYIYSFSHTKLINFNNSMQACHGAVSDG